MENVVAIDGPAGSGKSTVARLVAEELGFEHVDTGAMYRAITLKVLKAGVPLEDDARIAQAAAAARIECSGNRIFLDDVDATEEIRSGKVTKHVARISGIPAVRSALLSLQRSRARSASGIVMEGRDIGTVVFPDARWKFFLDANPEVRAERRHAELKAAGREKDRAWVLADLRERDRLDRERPIAPLRAADDARQIDTSELSIEEVVARIVEAVQEGKAPHGIRA